MLRALTQNSEPSGSVLVQDSLAAPGSSLLRSLADVMAARHSAVHFACLERRPEHMRARLRPSPDCPASYHDLTRDHRGWTGDTATPPRDLSRLVVAAGQLLVLDSLSALVSRVGLGTAYRQVHTLVGSGVVVVCLLHEDCLAESESTVKTLRHLFATCFLVEKPAETEKLRVVSRHIKKGGRVVRSTEHVSLDGGNGIAFLAAEVMKDVKDAGPAKVAAIPAELTTFRTELAPREKAARDRLVLPYVSAGGGKVFYEPDDADDWDDEDPDEDLEI